VGPVFGGWTEPGCGWSGIGAHGRIARERNALIDGDFGDLVPRHPVITAGLRLKRTMVDADNGT
jgi:hypothetical protein